MTSNYIYHPKGMEMSGNWAEVHFERVVIHSWQLHYCSWDWNN